MVLPAHCLGPSNQLQVYLVSLGTPLVRVTYILIISWRSPALDARVLQQVKLMCLEFMIIKHKPRWSYPFREHLHVKPGVVEQENLLSTSNATIPKTTLKIHLRRSISILTPVKILYLIRICGGTWLLGMLKNPGATGVAYTELKHAGKCMKYVNPLTVISHIGFPKIGLFSSWCSHGGLAYLSVGYLTWSFMHLLYLSVWDSQWIPLALQVPISRWSAIWRRRWLVVSVEWYVSPLKALGAIG